MTLMLTLAIGCVAALALWAVVATVVAWTYRSAWLVVRRREALQKAQAERTARDVAEAMSTRHRPLAARWASPN